MSLQADGSFSFTVNLEAGRLGQDLGGRQYQMTITAVDRAGNTATWFAFVIVPHDHS